MDIKHFYDVPTRQEVGRYGLIKFTPININYFLRLQNWHDKSFSEVQNALANVKEGDQRTALQLQDALVAMIHTATYPFVKDEHKSEHWEKTVWGWVVNKPKLVEWFLEYFQSFLPEGDKQGK